MNRIIKFILWGAGALLILVVVAVAAFAFLFDPNALRDDITRIVEKETGRQLTIEGDLALTFFPWLGFGAGRTTLSNAPGFDEPVMASFESASASVKLMPLLKRRIELSKITLDGADVNLAVKADGTSNWDDLTALQGDDTGEDSAGGGFAAEGIGGIRLTDTRVRYTDASTGDSYMVENLELETGALVPGAAFDLEGSGDITSGSHEMTGPARMAGQVQIEKDGLVRIASPTFRMDATGNGIPGDTLEIKFAAPGLSIRETTIDIDAPELQLTGAGNGDPWTRINARIDAESLKLEDFDRFDAPMPRVSGVINSPDYPGGDVEATMSGQRLQGSIDKEAAAIDLVKAQVLGLSISSRKLIASAIFEDPIIEAPIDVSEFAPIELLRKLDFNDIETANPKALTSASFTADARYAPDSMGVKNLKATIDGTAVTGSVRVMTSGEVRFDLTADAVNLDDYRAPAEDEAAGEAVAVADIEIPAEQLRELALNGTLRVGKMQLVGLQTTGVMFTIRAANGDIQIKPARASLYGGSYNGDIRLNASGPVPELSLNERLENVQFGPFSEDLLGQTRLSGTLDGQMTVTGKGHTSNELTGSANGSAVFSFADGAYEGTDIWYQVRRARAVIKGQAPPDTPVGNRTRFGEFKGTATIKDGVLTTNDLGMVLPFMKVRGQGSLALVSQEIDFRLKGDVVDRPELDTDVNDLVGMTVPIKMTGTMTAPSVGVDMQAVLADLAKRKLLGKIGLGASADTAEGEEEKPKDVKEELEDKLKDKLKGLFGGG